MGNRIQLRVLKVTPKGADSSDLLKIRERGLRVVAEGDRIYFEKDLIGKRPLEVTFGGSTPLIQLTRTVPLTACRQRMSIEFGQEDSGADVNGTELKGRISGCPLVGDWWVRAVPMFGGHEEFAIFDGYVQAPGGEFSVTVSGGERHILVVGKGGEPVKALGVNVTSGITRDLGTIDLAGSCPK
jgi:hypothetical protein